MIEVTADAVRVAIAADRSEATKLPGNKDGLLSANRTTLLCYLHHAGNADELKTVTRRELEIVQEIGAEPMNPSRSGARIRAILETRYPEVALVDVTDRGIKYAAPMSFPWKQDFSGTSP